MVIPVEDVVEWLSRYLHENCRTLQLLMREMDPDDPWDYTTEAVREGVRNSARYLLREVDPTPQGLQAEWCRYIQDELGYRYGPRRDAELKTEPNLVPYSHLDDVGKMKAAASVKAAELVKAHVADVPRKNGNI